MSTSTTWSKIMLPPLTKTGRVLLGAQGTPAYLLEGHMRASIWRVLRAAVSGILMQEVSPQLISPENSNMVVALARGTEAAHRLEVIARRHPMTISGRWIDLNL